MVDKSEIASCLAFHVLFSVELTNLFVVPSESKSADNLFVDVIFACLPSNAVCNPVTSVIVCSWDAKANSEALCPTISP